MAMEVAAMACVSGPPAVFSSRRASTEMRLSCVDSFAACKLEGAAFAGWRKSLISSSAREIQCSAVNGSPPAWTGRAVYEAKNKIYEGPKPISLVGTTGSIGTQTFGTVAENPEAFKVGALAAESDVTVSADQAPSKQKIRIKLRSYWTHLIRQACEQILEAAKNTNAKTMGPVPLPTKRRIYCVLRSPHVDKDSREHFEIRTHHRLIDLMNPNAQTIDALMQLDLPAGVDVEVKLT